MYRKILVPLDGSAFAERALPFAEALAKAAGTQVLLVHAAVARTITGMDPTDDQVRVVKEGEGYLAEVAARLAQQGITVETAVPYGSPGQAILDEIRLREADLVLMTTHGHSGLGRWIYGSVAEAVLHSSHIPVLLVQSWQGEHTWRALSERPRLLVPLDGSTFAEQALAPAATLAGQLGGELVLMQAVPFMEAVIVPLDPRPAIDAVAQTERAEDDAREYLKGVARRVRAETGIEVRVEVYVGEAADSIVAVSREQRAALVVMSTHGRTGVARVVFGSVAGGVLRRGSLPLLLVRPADVAAEETHSLSAASVPIL